MRWSFGDRVAFGIEHEETVDAHAVARSDDARVLHGEAQAVEYRGHGGKKPVARFGVDEHFAAAAQARSVDEDERMAGFVVACDAERLPGDFVVGESQEYFVGKLRPDALDGRRVDALVAKDRLRLRAAVGDAFGGIRRIGEAAAQRFVRTFIQIRQQLVFPRIPQFRAGAGNIGDRQHVKIIEPFAIADLFGERMHDIGST